MCGLGVREREGGGVIGGGRGWAGGGNRDGGPCTGHTLGQWRPQTTAAAPHSAWDKRGSPCTPASGPPSQGDRESQREGVSPSSIPSFLPLSSVLFVQPGGITRSRGHIQGPNRPGLIPFTCDPHFHNKMRLSQRGGDQKIKRSLC